MIKEAKMSSLFKNYLYRTFKQNSPDSQEYPKNTTYNKTITALKLHLLAVQLEHLENWV